MKFKVPKVHPVPIQKTAAAITLCLPFLCVQAAPPSAPRRVLFLGNSLTYSNNLPTLVQGLANAAGTPFTQTSIAIGGWDLGMHASYSLYAIDSGSYDIVVLQQYSTGNVIQQDWAVQILNNHTLAAGARSIFFNTPSWDFGPSDPNLVQFRQNTQIIRYNYAYEGNLYGIAISPAGLTWQTVRLSRPELNLYAPDGHPSLNGSYIMACTHFATIFGRSPIGNQYTGGVAPADAAYIQNVVSSAVLDDPWAVDLYGYAPNHCYWARDWSQFASEATSSLQGKLISGAGGQSIPAVRVATTVNHTGNVYLGIRDDTYPVPGQGRLYLFPGGSLQVAGDVIVGKHGAGYIEHRGGSLQVTGNMILAEEPGSVAHYNFSSGSLSAPQIAAGAGAATFTWTGGQVGFHDFGSASVPLDLTQQAGILSVGDYPGVTTIHGNLTQSSGAALVCMAGDATGLAIAGTATLAGTLTVAYPTGFAPIRGWSRAILSAASISGTFAQVNLPPMTNGGVNLVVSYSPTEVIATAIQDTTDSDGNGLPDWWETRVFGSASSGKSWTGTFEGTAVANGIMFAVASELAPSAMDALPRIESEGGSSIVRFIQRRGGSGTAGVDYTVDGLTYKIEVCDDLATGEWEYGVAELIARIDNGNGTETVTMSLAPTGGSGPVQRFVRLAVTRN